MADPMFCKDCMSKGVYMFSDYVIPSTEKFDEKRFAEFKQGVCESHLKDKTGYQKRNAKKINRFIDAV